MIMLGTLLGAGLSALGIGTTLSNNQQAQRNFREMLDFSKYQYEDQKKYNSMQEQVKRMRAAGINPALAIGSGQLGTSSGSTSLPSSPSFDSLGVGEMASGISSLQDVGQQRRLVNAESEGKEIENATKGFQNVLKIYDMLKDIEGKGYRNLRSKFDTDASRMLDMFSAQLNEIRSRARMENANAMFQDSASAEIDLRLPWIDAQQRQALLESLMRIKTGYQNATSNRISAKAATVSASAAKDSAKAAIRESMKQKGIYFGEGREEEENAFIQSVLDEMEANSYTPETTSYGNNFTFGGKLGGDLLGTGINIGGSNDRSTTQQKKRYNRYMSGKKRY